ncbi:MAG: sodium-independent anion transporter [Bacteroidetes bacterium]|nr:MAG: sodium-independent anion transporter [Bacteroidota bacterium]
MKNKIKQALFPFLSWWPMVNKSTIKADFGAGITNAVIVLPQGVAFAMIAGLPPIYGLYTAMVVPVIAALYGSSWHLISGPTTAISIVVFSSVSEFAEPGTQSFIALAFVLTFIAGAIQLMMGIARMGTLVNFVSHSVVVGFTAGAAVLIATSQFKHIFGFTPPKGASFYQNWEFIVSHLGETNLYVFGIAMATLLTAILVKKFTPKIPNMLVAMLVGSLVAYFWANGEDGVLLVGKLPAELPSFLMPELTGENIIKLTPNAIAVALLGLIEAVAIARSIATKSHQNLNGNQEFIGQGLSNIIGSMFMSYAGSGSFTRSGINYQAGAKTPMSAIFAAVSLGLILLLVAPLTAYLPIAAMGGIILMVAYNLIDFHHIIQINKSSKQELIVLIVTFLATLFLHLEFAIYFGVILSLIFYLMRTSKPSIVPVGPIVKNNVRQFRNIELNALDQCPQLKIIRVDGALFFGATEHVSKTLDDISEQGFKHILIIANGINIIDISGAEMLVNYSNKLKSDGGSLYLCALNKTVRDFMEQGGYNQSFNLNNIFINKEIAISEIYKRLDRPTCDNCEVRVFMECNK